MFNEGPLFLHQHENVHEQVPELLHIVLQAQQLLSVEKDNTGINTADMKTISQRRFGTEQPC